MAIHISDYCMKANDRLLADAMVSSCCSYECEISRESVHVVLPSVNHQRSYQNNHFIVTMQAHIPIESVLFRKTRNMDTGNQIWNMDTGNLKLYSVNYHNYSRFHLLLVHAKNTKQVIVCDDDGDETLP